VEGGGSWEIDALMGSWPVLSGINPERAKVAFDTALRLLEKERVILLGWPALREYGKPFLGRGSRYPEGVRESGMYCHGVQWLVRAARIISERAQADGDVVTAARYRDASLRLWLKISPLSHVTPLEIENYGGQPNKQAADILAGPYPGRMIWNGYTGAAGWMLRQACEGVLGFALEGGVVIPPADLKEPRGDLMCRRVVRAASEGGARGAWPF
jgi:cyclic beta-1,2-glucan synthetase